MTNLSFPTESLTEDSLQEFTLEYLAVFDIGKTFRETLTAFCNDFSLLIEEDEVDFIAASGDDFALRAKPISSGTAFSDKVALIAVSAESKYDLENAKEVIEEYTSDDTFDQLILLRDSVGERRTREAYLLLNELENMLRKVVAVRATSMAGPEWWTSVVQQCVFASRSGYRYERYRNQELNDRDITRQNDQSHHDIFYLDLSDLKAIVEAEKNWKNGFSCDLKVLKNIERLDFLNRLRRKIAHNRFLSQSNLDDLRRIYEHLMHLCRRAIGEP